MLLKKNHFLVVLFILLSSINVKALVATKASTIEAPRQVQSHKIAKHKRSLKERILTKILKRKIRRNLSKTKHKKEPISAERMSKLGLWGGLLSGLGLLLSYGLAVVSSAYILVIVLGSLSVLLALFGIVASIIALVRNHREGKDKMIILRSIFGILLGIVGFLAGALLTVLLLVFPY